MRTSRIHNNEQNSVLFKFKLDTNADTDAELFVV